MTRRLLLALALALPATLPACAAETPAVEAGEGDELVVLKPTLDPVRAAMETKLKTKVVFKIQHLREQSGWAFFLGRPLAPSGQPLDYSKTVYKAHIDAGAFDETCAALLKQVNGKWTLVAHSFGSTDAAWPGWAAQHKAPTAIFQLQPAAVTSMKTPTQAERKAILDTLRVPVVAELKGPILFEVTRLKILTGWAFVGAIPQRADGSAIDYTGTKYQAKVEAGAFDGGVFALLKLSGGKWQVVTYDIGSTDAPWMTWAEKHKAPAALFQ